MGEISIVRRYPYPVSSVWRALTDPHLIPRWTDDGGGETTAVTYRLEPAGDGTRFTYEHTAFTGVGGLFMSRLLSRVRRTMLTEGLPTVLRDESR